ncbi:DMT family transporter [uncultured Ferrovibrio sp.]|jgi:drug/metabolite transporter (DMT)-like permease|uniref:DMT family transporter n=1 Tax=uncultured Ferrovibrio sp. TaxID=1576913 RepID=UPI00261B9BCE|nr:DMT family transporter [uncultured Ferrovibrio sp.]
MKIAPLAAASVGIQVGAAMVATRFVVGESGPATLAMMRYAIGALCLLPLLHWQKQPMRFARRDILPIAGLGIVQFGVLIALLNYGLSHVSAARAALLFACFPLLTMIVAALLGRESLTWAKTAGVLLTIAGVALALGEKVFAAASADHWIGEAAVLLAALCGAVCSVLYRPYLQRYPTLPVGAFAMLASVGFLALLAAYEGAFTTWSGYSAPGWAAVIFIGISSGLFYFIWLWALRHTSPTRVTIFLGLSPVTAALLGTLLLDEPFTMPLAAGLLLVLAGLWLAHRPKARSASA